MLENFFWHTVCDNYLEIAKDRLYNPDKRGEHNRRSAQFTLYNTFLNIIKMFAPIMPHITEAVYHMYWEQHEKAKSIHLSRWPEYSSEFVDTLVEETGDKFVEIMASVRKFKSEKNLSLKVEISRLTIQCDEKTRKELEFAIDDLKSVCKAEKIDFEECTKGIEVSEDIKISVELKSKSD